MSGVRKGGCLCGAVRYEADWPPLAVAVCHCRNCQKQAGSALSVVAFLKRGALRVTGDLSIFVDRSETGNAVYRKFCPRCGSPVVTDTDQAKTQGIIFIKAGTLDDTHDLAPTTHYWSERAQDWFVFPDGAARLARQ
jgi:hypothetical protein